MFQFRRAPGQLSREPFICIEGDLVLLLLAVDFQNQFVWVYGDALQSVSQDLLLLMDRLFIEPIQEGPDDLDGIVQFDHEVLES
ncbi:MAG: hypothetical protein ACK5Y2_08065 [Bdellovibrionales bacterium]